MFTSVIMRDEVYEPGEDSFLLEKNIPIDLKKKKVLEIGCGSGILSIKCAELGAIVTAVDINENALKETKKKADTKKLKIKLIESNLFEKIKEKFNLILFNPPYVPCENEDLKGESAWVGGKKGRRIIDRFLKDFEKYLNKNGTVLLLISSFNELKNELENKNWKCIDEIKLSDETLFIMKFQK